jgi:enoyl-CoA hydratase
MPLWPSSLTASQAARGGIELTDSDFENVLYETDDDGLATITLNRPNQLNALSWALLADLEKALRRAEKDPRARVIILKGAGRCFSAGYDFAEMPPVDGDRGVGPADGKHEPRGRPELGRGMWNSRAHVQGHVDYERVIWDLWKPVISQVHGFALAGGSTLALVCDLTICTKSAKFGYPPVRWLSTGDNIAIYSYLVGLKKAKELSFGQMVSGEEAERLGLVNYSVADDKLEEHTRTIAKRVAAIDPELLMLNKMAVNRIWEIRGITTAMGIGGEVDSLAHLAGTGKPMADALERNNGNLAAALKELNLPWGGV